MDVTITETLRPELIEKGLFSFVAHLSGVEWRRSRCFINIDPVGPGTHGHVILQLKRVFGEVIARMPDRANFAAAVKWCWSSTESEYVLHLETDWEMTGNASRDHLIAQMNETGCQAVNLKAHKDDMKGRLCLSPCIIRGSVARALAERLDTTSNPEAQLREPSFRAGGRGLAVHVKSLHWPNVPILKDLGGAWRRENGYALPGINFTHWIRS